MLRVHFGISVKLTNLTNQVQVEEMFTRMGPRISKVYLHFLGLKCGGEVSDSFEHHDVVMSETVAQLVTVQEAMKAKLPCTQMILTVESTTPTNKGV